MAVLAGRALRPAQGITRVAGVEVTAQDVRVEARAQGVVAGGSAGPSLIDAVVARRLLAQEARRRGLDRRPDYPSARRRADELTLAQALIATLPPPPPASDAAVGAYIAAHPDAFQARRRWTVDALSVSSTLAPVLSGLAWDDLKPRLAAARIAYAPHPFSLTTPEIPAALRVALERVTPGGLIFLSDAGRTTIYRLVSVEPAPLEGEGADIVARGELQNAARRAQVTELLERLRGGKAAVRTATKRRALDGAAQSPGEGN